MIKFGVLNGLENDNNTVRLNDVKFRIDNEIFYLSFRRPITS